MVYTRPPASFHQYGIDQAISLEQTTSYPSYHEGEEDAVLPSATSLVQITALPPAKTSLDAVLPKLPYHRQLNVLYTIPLFVMLGVVLGAISAAALVSWRERRRRLRRTSTLLPGPPYVHPENDAEDHLLVHGGPSMEQVSLFAAPTPSKFTIHGSRYVPTRTFAWKTLDANNYSQSTHSQTIIPSSDDETFTVVTEQDPFLATSTRRSPKPCNDASPRQTCLSPSLQDSTAGDNSNPPDAQNTSPTKPFRRSMFDILKLKGPYRSETNTREQYTALSPNDDHDKTPQKEVRRVRSLKATLAGERRSCSARYSLNADVHTRDEDGTTGLLSWQGEGHIADSSNASSHKAFRLQGGTLSSPSPSKRMGKPREATPFASESEASAKVVIDGGGSPSGIEHEKAEDIYTTAPQRRRSRTPRKKVSDSDSSRRASTPDMHASVLPLSPPLLMSPPLEKALFLTSSMSSSASLASHMTALSVTHLSPPHCSPDASLFPLPSNGSKASRKLRTKRPEPPLPYPSYPVFPPTSQARSPRADLAQRSVSPGSPKPKGRPTSAAQRESTTGVWSLGSLSPSSLAIALASSSSASRTDMLDRVNDIVAQGYTKKRASMAGEDDEAGVGLADAD